MADSKYMQITFTVNRSTLKIGLNQRKIDVPMRLSWRKTLKLSDVHVRVDGSRRVHSIFVVTEDAYRPFEDDC